LDQQIMDLHLHLNFNHMKTSKTFLMIILLLALMVGIWVVVTYAAVAKTIAIITLICGSGILAFGLGELDN